MSVRLLHRIEWQVHRRDYQVFFACWLNLFAKFISFFSIKTFATLTIGSESALFLFLLFLGNYDNFVLAFFDLYLDV